jgi:hypothetical protein
MDRFQALKTEEIPSRELVCSTVQKMQATPSKKYFFKRSTKVALAFAAMIFLMVVTASAAYYMGAFDRLRGIVGYERADALTPLEIVNERPFYDGIDIQLVAIEMLGDLAFAYFTIQDLTGNRLDGDFSIMHTISPLNHRVDVLNISIASPEIINRDENGVITFRTRFDYSHELTGFTFMYTVSSIFYDMLMHPPFISEINLADLANRNPQTMIFQTNVPAFLWRGDMLTTYLHEKITGEGLEILTPHNLDLDLELERIYSIISSIGVINDKLHIQVYNPAGRYNFLQFDVLREYPTGGYNNGPRREIVDIFGTTFRVNEDGTLRPEGNITLRNLYHEFIFDIDTENLYRYVLMVHASASRQIDINWRTMFDLY